MAYQKIKLQNLRLDNRYKILKKLSGKEFPSILRFIDGSKNGEKNNKGIDIVEETERKYIDAFGLAYKSCKKPLLKLTKDDLTKLKQDLKKGKIKSRFKKPYSDSTQRDMELILIRFLEDHNPKKYSGFRKWFVIRVKQKSPEILTEAEIEKLYKSCKSNEERYLMAVLFDTGFRASEFLNLRFEDFQEPSQDFPYYRIDLKGEYSKTLGRNIGLYWKHSTEIIRDYLSELDNSNPKEQVYKKNYDAVRMLITRLGKKVLKKRVHFHMLRKSLATYYAPKMNRQELCYRYGWRFSSSVPDVYISRAGMKEEAVKDKILNTNFGKLEKENQELNTKMGLMREQLEEFGKYAPLLKAIQKRIKADPKVIKIIQEE